MAKVLDVVADVFTGSLTKPNFSAPTASGAKRRAGRLGSRWTTYSGDLNSLPVEIGHQET